MGAPPPPVTLESEPYLESIEEQIAGIYAKKAYKIFLEYKELGVFKSFQENHEIGILELGMPDGRIIDFNGWNSACHGLHYIAIGYLAAMRVQVLPDNKITQEEKLRRIKLLSS